jgi:tRNA pseudouridine38-40 synthase
MRLALGLEYDGGPHCGWQSQPCGCGIQDKVQASLSSIACETIVVVAAGRTDAGVHACGQVAHFDTRAARPPSAWVRGVNTSLPESVRVLWAQAVPNDFHARFEARSRTYRYWLYNHPVRPALLGGKVGWHHRPLDAHDMDAAAQALVGEHDFSSFRAAECQAPSPVKTLYSASVRRSADYVVFDFTATAFLHHMVRNMVGCLVCVGAGKVDARWLVGVLAARDRTLAAPTFAAAGLYLMNVRYDARFGLPDIGGNGLLPGFES